MQANFAEANFQFEFVEAAPDPTVVVSVDGICLALNSAAASLLPAMRVGGALVLGLRAPDVLEGFRRVASGGMAEKAYWSERVPLERLFEVHYCAAERVESRRRQTSC